MSKKIKITPIASKAKEIDKSEGSRESPLEEEIEESERENFQNFISTGKMRAPILEVDESQQTTPDATQRPPEIFSQSENERRSVNYVTQTTNLDIDDLPKYNPQTFREQTTLRSESQISSDTRHSGGISFRDSELDKLRGKDREKQYTEKIKMEDAKPKRKMPREA